MFPLSFTSTAALALMACAASFVLGFPVCAMLRRRGVLDQPNLRSSHDRPTVRGGGIAIMAAVILGIFIAHPPPSEDIMIPLGVIAISLAVLSFWDDLKSLPPAIRFGGHAVAALAVLDLIEWPQLEIGISPNQTIQVWTWCGVILMFLWLTGYTNAFNFMDGINGIAAGQALVTAGGSAVLLLLAANGTSSAAGLLAAIIAGAAAGFLPHNFPRARMFMGDVGSAPVGFLLAALVIWIARDFGWWLLIPLALLHANYVLDTGITLVRRILRGDRWYKPHREHFYQRLVRAGKTHTFVTLWEMGLQLVVLGLMVIYLRVSSLPRFGLILLVFLVWGSFFAYCEYTFRQAAAKTEHSTSNIEH